MATYGIELSYLGGVPLDVPNTTAVSADLRTRVSAMVAEVADELAGSTAPGVRDLDVILLVSGGSAAHALLERSEGAALLVVGSRGRGAVRSALLGSVALHCATHAPCPVVVVHPTAAESRPSGRIVVGIDGSDASRTALAAAVEEAARTGAEVEAVATYLMTDYWVDLATVVIPTSDEIRADLTRRTQQLADDVLARWADREKKPGPTVRTTVVEGPAGDVLVHHARSADLLVVGSRGRGAFRGLLLGSVALHCAMTAPCPVMVVHPMRSRSAAGESRPEPAMADH